MALPLLLAASLAVSPIARAQAPTEAAPPASRGDTPAPKADTPASGAPHPLSGTWRMATPEEELRASLSTAIDQVAGEFNVLFRDVVRQKLQGATKVCAAYTFDLQSEAVVFSCDGRPPVTLARDGSPFQTLNEAGEPVQGRVAVDDDRLTLTWTGAVGGRTNEFVLKEGTLVLHARVTSSRIPQPMSWSIDYARASSTR